MTEVSLVVGDVDLSHSRLVELFRLADAAKPYYDWLSVLVADADGPYHSLDQLFREGKLEEVTGFIRAAQDACDGPKVPSVFDGAARPYKPRKALYLMISWAIRDAPQQRLAPLLAQIRKGGMSANDAESQALARLIVHYRGAVATFEWSAVREVVAARLEGSRRSLRGKLAEAAVRAVVAEAISEAASQRTCRFDRVTLSATEVNINGHSFDVCVDCEIAAELVARIVMPVKSRETQGGGHANLFTRDIEAAMAALREHQRSTEVESWMVPVIIAENWHEDQIAHVREISDALILVRSNPNSFESLPPDAARELEDVVLRIIASDR